jgi:enoyl-CoA hydratase/carnithine racemase
MDEDLGAAGLRFEREGVIGWCIIDRPEARNALTGAMYYGIKKAVLRVDSDPELAALIITGTGDVFAPGGDLGGRAPDERDAPVPEVSAGESLPFTAIRQSRKPVIAAVNGICQGGGLLIAMMADIAVVSDRATFRVPELLRGIIDATYAYTLPAHVGLAVARDLLVSARRFGAQEAQAYGLISRVVPHDDLREAALKAAGEVLQTAPVARMHVKRMLNERYGLIDYPTMMWGLAESPEPREGFSAFMEKRAPNWIPAEFVDGSGRR